MAIGAINVHEGFSTSEFEVYIKPADGLVIDVGAANVNGGVNPRGIEEREALEAFVKFVKSHEYSQRTLPIMGHNVGFDVNFMTAAGRRQSIPWKAFRLSYRTYDTCVLASTEELKGNIQHRSLDSMCRSFGLYARLNRAILGHKSPLNDCRATLAVFYELLWRSV
jgi:DNA polymerase III epsilon subunit-like protein